jgi:CubicO group peptidase (beta-lactamase class C family)
MHPNFSTEELDSFVQHTLDTWHAPGVAVAVVKDGEVILSQGFRLRNVAQNLPATADTIFPIASCTKAFTAACLALLVDEGKLEWDKPVKDFMPAFKLYDDFATSRMTPRDLLCHRSGLPRHDLVWYASRFSRREVFKRLRYCEPNKDLRTTFQYQNMMYMVAGLLVEELTGLTWEKFVQQRIFDVLGMARSNTSSRQMREDANHGFPYLWKRATGLKEIDFYDQDESISTGPAGTICSTVSDLSKWVQVQLGGGRLGEVQFLSANAIQQMHTPHIFIDDAQLRLRFGMEFTSYALGWFTRSYKGQVLVQHGGNIDGFSSLVSLLPRRGLGVAVLTNSDGYYNSVPAAITYTLYDRLLGLEETDWNARLIKFSDEGLDAEEKGKAVSGEERKSAVPSHPIADYLGEYTHPGYGSYVFSQEGEMLKLVANDTLTMVVKPYHYDIFEAINERWEMNVKLRFETDSKGSICGFYAQLEPSVKELYFTKQADQRLSDPTYLRQFCGEYDLLGMLLVISLRETCLVASLPDQEHVLVPYQGTEFTLKGETGFGIKFKLDETGVCQSADLYQPGAVFTAKRK